MADKLTDINKWDIMNLLYSIGHYCFEEYLIDDDNSNDDNSNGEVD